jgi:hypothetical protein
MKTFNVKPSFVCTDLVIQEDIHMFVVNRPDYCPFFAKEVAGRFYLSNALTNLENLARGAREVKRDLIWQRVSKTVYSTISMLGFYPALFRFPDLTVRDTFETLLLTSPSRLVELYRLKTNRAWGQIVPWSPRCLTRAKSFGEIVACGVVSLNDDGADESIAAYTVSEWYGNDALGGFALIEESRVAFNLLTNRSDSSQTASSQTQNAGV